MSSNAVIVRKCEFDRRPNLMMDVQFDCVVVLWKMEEENGNLGEHL